MIHPHDTDRILGVLGDAIVALREEAGEINEWTERDTVWSDHLLEIANDLALLHGAVSAEAERAETTGVIGSTSPSTLHMDGTSPVVVHVQATTDELRDLAWSTVTLCVVGPHPRHPSLATRHRGAVINFSKREEIELEVQRGEHREED